MAETAKKQAYTITCSTAFRDQVEDLARRRRCNVGDLARSVLFALSEDVVAASPDPGGPGEGDREAVILKTGRAQGRPWRRKPRLQLRLPAAGYTETTVRKALGIALAMDRGELTLTLSNPRLPPALPSEIQDELVRLRAMVSVLSFEPLTGGVRSRQEALHVLGFPPTANPGSEALRARFRLLATIHHPDGGQGNHARMSQLNAAIDILRRA
jgi:hypothetical protein